MLWMVLPTSSKRKDVYSMLPMLKSSVVFQEFCIFPFPPACFSSSRFFLGPTLDGSESFIGQARGWFVDFLGPSQSVPMNRVDLGGELDLDKGGGSNSRLGTVAEPAMASF